MNPFGFLDSEVGLADRPALAGTFTGAEMEQFLTEATPALAAGNWAALEAVPLGGKLFVMATDRQGRSTRFGVGGQFASLTEPEVLAAVRGLTNRKLLALERLDHEDNYYYSGFENKAEFPVYRARFDDAEATTFYLDGQTGRLLGAFDSTQRQGRWLRTGLHDMDFFAGLRMRPVWDLVVLFLLAGVTAVCATGAWLGLKRIRRDAEAVWGRVRRGG
jgi:hypothetical protein